MLYPKEDKINKRLLFACRNCQYEEEADNACVYRHEIRANHDPYRPQRRPDSREFWASLSLPPAVALPIHPFLRANLSNPPTSPHSPASRLLARAAATRKLFSSNPPPAVPTRK
ncbi:hypothetical protein BC936DRAFT_144998 [Jimgerdemannia flammicorona]|uniref:DNA-directed RNA polymerase II subunit RPB9-like zinc ribbon domain-containing protein n=1 Tax=Jimgerdemannia flammicorona TaxID=994334 RepID=A0A433DB49_9FUNG|nr:hypothetical protein BC936DRAFT_144998 [Jimgerdemannia flammicorona]